jgi:ATP-binding cassette subfamily B protein
MHKGKVREVGSHQQLLANRGIYWKLYQLQYKDQEIPTSAAIAANEYSATGVNVSADD